MGIRNEIGVGKADWVHVRPGRGGGERRRVVVDGERKRGGKKASKDQHPRQPSIHLNININIINI